MNKILYLIFPLFLFLSSCQKEPHEQSIEKWKQEIRDTEKAFAELSVKEGIHNAFIAFAAEDAVLMRGDSLIEGRKNIDEFYKNSNSTGLSWSPDFVDVSSSGDLGYTYDTYTYSYKDSTGQLLESKGIFHTVWKRQKDGSWKYVWD